MYKITLIIAVWKRFKHLDNILKAWLKQPEIDELIIWDNSGHYRPIMPIDERIKIISISYNIGTWARMAAANFARNDIVMITDDDIIVQEGFVADLLESYDENKLIGIWGRRFEGDYKSGFKKENEFRADKISELTIVDFVIGLVHLTHRNNIIRIDFRDLMWTCYDLHFNGILKVTRPDIIRCIAPTTKWTQTPEETDEFALNRHPDALKEKQILYEGYFKE